MKKLKRILALAVALAMVLSMSAMTAFAAGSQITPSNSDTGRIEITQSTGTVTLNDRVFRAYRILDVDSKTDDGNGGFATVAYTVPANTLAFWTNNANTGLSIDWTGVDTSTTSAKIDNLVTQALKALGDDDSAAIKAFAEKAQAWAKDNLDYYQATGASDKVTFNNLPFGYYIVDDQTTTPADGSSISAVILDTATPAQTIVVKATTVPSDKKITGVDTGEAGQTGETPLTSTLEDNDDDGNMEVVDVSVGDTIHFQVDSKVPDTRGYNAYKFVVNDTLDKGLKLKADTVKIKIGDDTYTAASEDLTVTVDPNPSTGATATTLKIVLKGALAKFTKTGVDVGDAITITYDAELTEDAPVGTKVENKVTINYSNNPKYDYDGTKDDFQTNEPKGTTPEKKTETYTTELTVLKVDESGKPLSGAEFTLTGETAHTVVIYDETYVADASGAYWKLADGSYTTDDPTTAKASDATQPEYDLSKYDGYTDGDGLAEAANYQKYKLQKNTSTKTTIDENSNRNGVKKTTGSDGVVTFSGLAEGTYTITETGVPAGYNGIDPITTQITFSYDSTNKVWKFSATNVDDDQDNTFSVKIQNNKGTELPSTGGIGTTIFYVVGAILVVGAGVVMITRRRMDA